MDDVLLADGWTQRAELDAGRVTSEALTRGYLDRIAQHNERLRGFVHVAADQALTAARRADEELRTGRRTPVLGLCFGIKDNIDVQGMPTTHGSRAFADNVAITDAEAVRRLRDAGAVFLGKCNTFEFAMSAPSPLYRPSRNPWDLYRVTGGSSNGSATAASAGLCSIAIGSDTAGSIRNPAAYCGLAGLKPTHGRVSRRGLGLLAASMDTIGPMTRGVRDAALVLAVIGGYDPADMLSADIAPILPSVPDASPVVIGIPDGWPTDLLSPEVLANWRATIALLEQAGASTRTVRLPDYSDTLQLWGALASAEMLAWHEDAGGRAELYGEVPLATLTRLRQFTAADHFRAREAAWRLRQGTIDAMAGCDVIVLPTCPVPAFTFDEANKGEVHSGEQILTPTEATNGCTRMFNLTGQPAMAVPSGLTASGLPLSVQVIGRPFDERTILQVARSIEKAVDFSYRPTSLRN